MIKPTVGRVVWFYKGSWNYPMVQRDQPLAAMIAYVYSDTMVNLSVIDADGNQHPVTKVYLVQDNNTDIGPEKTYCCWMPYQMGQAAKTEAAEAAAKK